MKLRAVACVLAIAAGSTGTAHAFFEEGNDDPARPGYAKCNEQGNLAQADMNGCNPWPDWDSSYSFRRLNDMKKNSLHYNATAALAVAAGFERCAALIIAAYNEATDVATDYDAELWVPFMDGMDPAMCEGLVLENKGEMLDGLKKPGFMVAPDFTYRSFSKSQTNEVERESFTFHWNHSLTTIDALDDVQCSAESTDPLPVPPRDMVNLNGLVRWTQGENSLNSCSYSTAEGLLGPIVAYHPEQDVAPGSLGSMGVFLHSLQDAYSHRPCGGTTHNFGGNTTSPCGFASGHYAGDFGVLPSTGMPGSGDIVVKTPARERGYKVALHSDQSVMAINHTYQALKNYLANNPEYSRGVPSCPDSVISSFATRFSSIPNIVPASGQPSGAKQRSDLADALFMSDTCGQ